MNYTEFSEPKVRHLEMIQAVISRLASQSGNVKIATVLLGAAAISGAAALKEQNIALFSILFAILFGLLDAQYLRDERKYRGYYNDVAFGSKEIDPFRMNILNQYSDSETIWSSVTSWSVWPFYFAVSMLMLMSYLSILVEQI